MKMNASSRKLPETEKKWKTYQYTIHYYYFVLIISPECNIYKYLYYINNKDGHYARLGYMFTLEIVDLCPAGKI